MANKLETTQEDANKQCCVKVPSLTSSQHCGHTKQVLPIKVGVWLLPRCLPNKWHLPHPFSAKQQQTLMAPPSSFFSKKTANT
jgi:hypothetical protein